MSKHVVIAWTHYAFILDMSSWMLYCILGNTTMDACSFCSKFCTYKLCLISKYTVVNCEIYVTNTTAYLSLTSNNAFIYQAIYIKHSSIRLYIKQGIHPSGYTLNRTFIYQISQGHLACGSRSSGGCLYAALSFFYWEASCGVIAENLFCTDVACLTLLRSAPAVSSLRHADLTSFHHTLSL